MSDLVNKDCSDCVPIDLQDYEGSVLTCTYPHKPMRKIVTICSHQTDTSHLVWPGDLQALKRIWSYVTPNVLTETRCHQTTQIVRNANVHLNEDEEINLSIPEIRNYAATVCISLKKRMIVP